ncbi:MAG TPA: hypothetical protein VK465_18740, partial [Fibrobacteria bacterium]|nr:hypothetical protein [Fibrobacteria bacterium]
LMELAMYREGRLHGTFKSFSPDGRLLVTKEYRGGEVAFDSKAKELLELLGAEDARVPVGLFGLYWGMTPGEARGALSVLEADGVRQEAGTLTARATVLSGRDARPARLRLRFNDQGELWEIRAEISPRTGEDAFALCDRLEAEMGAELGRPEMRKTGNGGDWRMTRRREWGRFSLTTGTEVPVRQDLPVVTAEATGAGTGSLRFTLGNPLFREYVNPANASVTPPEWHEDTFLAGR